MCGKGYLPREGCVSDLGFYRGSGLCYGARFLVVMVGFFKFWVAVVLVFIGWTGLSCCWVVVVG